MEITQDVYLYADMQQRMHCCYREEYQKFYTVLPIR